MADRIGRWFARNAPKREDLARSPWLRPLGGRVMRSELWRLTRRSVPRGVGLGLLVGIFLMVPGLQIVGAALVSVPFRANIPVAAAMTFFSNPATTPLILVASIWVGNLLGFHADLEAFTTLYRSGAGAAQWTGWLFSSAAPALVTGLLVIACASGVAGYLLSGLFWRWRTGRKWRRRVGRVRMPAATAAD